MQSRRRTVIVFSTSASNGRLDDNFSARASESVASAAAAANSFAEQAHEKAREAAVNAAVDHAWSSFNPFGGSQKKKGLFD